MNVSETVRRSSLITPINRPRFVDKARRVLARANAIAAKEARKAEALHLAGVA